MIRRPAAAAFVAISLFACTRVLDIGDQGGADGPCGEGTSCRAGVMCTRTCESCFCNDKSIWYCSSTCAAETGGECPATPPSDGSTCTTTGVSCTYKNPCGELDAALCVDSKWQYYYARCPLPAGCPPTPPMPATPCDKPGLACPYPNKCGVVFAAECDGTAWRVPRPPPCPDAGCPEAPPEPRATCTGEMKCEWPNDCGTRDFGYCAAGYWTVNRTCTPTTCPPMPPPDGAPCSQEGLVCPFTAGCTPGNYRNGTCESGSWRIGVCN